MDNKTIFQEKNTRLTTNNTDLKSILTIINNLPPANGSSDNGETVGTIIDRTITELINNDATKVGEYALRSCTKLETVDLPNATSVEQYAFQGCSVLASVNLPSVTSISQYAFNQCIKIKEMSLPEATTISSNAFRDTQYMEILDLPKLTSIPANGFYGCRGLKALILRSNTLVTLANTSAFTTCYRILGTKNSGFNPNGEKIGFFYVPKALIEDYKVATNWSDSSLVTQFRAIEDYPDICG